MFKNFKFKISKDLIYKYNKNTVKIKVSQASRTRRLFASLNIHCNDCLNTEVQK